MEGYLVMKSFYLNKTIEKPVAKLIQFYLKYLILFEQKRFPKENCRIEFGIFRYVMLTATDFHPVLIMNSVKFIIFKHDKTKAVFIVTMTYDRKMIALFKFIKQKRLFL